MPARLVAASLYTVGLLIGFLGIIFYIALYVTGTFDWILLLILIVGFNVLTWLVGPWFTALLHKWLYKMKFLTRDEFKAQFPELEAFVVAVCEQQKIKFPRFGFIEDDNPTAYTFGSGAFNARVILTRGLFTYLSKEEVQAVVAHELGHIVHRDFIVMAAANTVIQLFYAIFRMFTSGKGDSDKKGGLQYIGWASYVLYLIGTYMVLYLNRVRESYADQFAARITGAPGMLSHALIKIGYGIVAKEDTKSGKGLMENTATLGIMGFKSAQAAGLMAKTTEMDPVKVTQVALYDLMSPWAKLAGLTSTHPLIGTRLHHLDQTAKELGTPPVFQFESALLEHEPEKQKMWSAFWGGATIYYLPFVLIIILPLVLLIGGPIAVPDVTLGQIMGVYILLVAFAYLVRVVYMFPGSKEDAQPVTMLELMSDLYASPAHGKRVRVEGQLIGRGQPGFVFSEDVMLQDKTGYMYLDYASGIPVFGNILFAWRKVQGLLGKAASADGWFFRANTQYIALSSLEVEGKRFRSFNRFWNYVEVAAVWIIAVILLAGQESLFAFWYIPAIGLGLIGLLLARRNRIKPVVDPAAQTGLSAPGAGKRIVKGVFVGILLLIIISIVVGVLSNL